MKILIDIGHPAHIHLFKNIAWNLQKSEHIILFTLRIGEKEIELIRVYGFNYKLIGQKRSSLFSKFWGLILYSARLLKISHQFQADLYLSHSSVYAGIAALVRRKPHIALEDSGNLEQLRLSKPLSTVILTPDVLETDLGRKQIKYSGYHELAYLSPTYFKPDSSILAQLGIQNGDKYCVVRFSGWKATHDFKKRGLGEEDKTKLIKYLSNYFRVLISSEMPLTNELEIYDFPLSPEKIHDTIAFSDLVISEGATIAAEAGILGIPSIYVNPIVRYYNEDLERYGLVYNFRDSKGIIEKVEDILNIPNYKSQFKIRKEKMLNEKIEVSSFLTWFVEYYPFSKDKMKSDPEHLNFFSMKSTIFR